MELVFASVRGAVPHSTVAHRGCAFCVAAIAELLWLTRSPAFLGGVCLRACVCEFFFCTALAVTRFTAVQR